MKKLAVWLMLAVMFFIAVSAGCGGGSDSSDPEQTESLNEDTGEYDTNGEGRGVPSETPDRYYTASNDETLTGTISANVVILIADGATVTLRDVTINEANSSNYRMAGIECRGDATIILEGDNYVTGFHENYPGIHVPAGKTLTIKGEGSLTASSNGYAAGIGGGRFLSCGNIVIENGTITTIGGLGSAGIGSGLEVQCGNITITGGTVYAIGGYASAGIGSGNGGRCGSITIAPTVTQVTAVKGVNSQHSIGAGKDARCGTVTIGGKKGAISDESYTYKP